MPRPERRQSLTISYMFECNCQASDADWPTYANMIPSEAVLYNLHSDCQGVRCGACGHVVDFGERIRMLRVSWIARLLALSKNAAFLMIFDQVLVSPNRDYQMCQQGMRHSHLDLGSCYVAYPSSEINVRS
uniref:Uncharacterized protein n=1 Tax=Anopheles minimus TaxID=112268 RepID=A0A182VU52_9DIPT